jgi:Predicted aminoglycoside phosphotransferase
MERNAVDVLLDNVKTFLPEFKIREHRALSGGWNSNVLLLNGDTVCRFPITKYGKTKMLKEIELLSHMKSYPVTVPKYEYFHDSDPVFGLYRYTDGVPIKDCNSRGNQMIADFSEILQYNKSHSSEFKKLQYMDVFTPDEWKVKMEKLILLFQDELVPTIEQEFFTSLRIRVKTCLDSLCLDDMSFIHGDLSKDNVIISRNHKRIKGILDWADSSIGDVALDLAAIVDDMENISTKRIYNILSRVVNEVPMERVMMYRAIAPLYHAFFISRTQGDEMLERVYRENIGPTLKRRYRSWNRR